MTDEPDLIEPEEEPGAEERRYPSTIGGAFYLAILAVCAGGVAVVAGGDWRLGVRVIAVGLMVAAGLRLILPARDAGMLAVRHRAIDVTVLAVMGGLIYFLALSIPDQPQQRRERSEQAQRSVIEEGAQRLSRDAVSRCWDRATLAEPWIGFQPRLTRSRDDRCATSSTGAVLACLASLATRRTRSARAR